jgi:phage antirepressor YoqD-like protein
VNSQNKEQPCYSLNRDGIIQMTVSESAVVRYKMVEYINQLESEIQQLRLPKNYKEALIALVEAEEVKEKQQLLIEEMKPKVEGYEDLLSVQSNHTMNDVAKVVGIGRNTLFKILRDNKVLMKDNLPYQDFIDRGYFSVREVVIKRVEYEDVKRQTLVTTKGVDYINKKLKEWM